MKILQLIKNFDCGGAESHVCALANELVRLGNDVWLLSRDGRQRKLLFPGVVCDSAAFSEWRTPSLLYKIIKLVRRERIDLIHAHQRLAIFLATMAGMVTKTPVVATVHGSTFHDLRSGFVRRNIARLIVVSENSYNIQRRHPVLGKKVHLIPNGFAIPALEALNNRQDPPFRFLYVSRLDDRHQRLLARIITRVWPRIVEKYPGSSFHIVGDGQGLGKLMTLLSHPDCRPWRHSVVCEKYAMDVSPHYQKADLVLGVGRVVGESLSHGVPALSIKHNHLGPILTRANFDEICHSNFVAIKAPPPQPEKILDGLEEFMARSSFYKAEAFHLQKIMAQRFAIQAIVSKTQGLYQDVCGQTGKQTI